MTFIPAWLEDVIFHSYKSVKRKERDGSMSEAIKTHAQACGVLAYMFDLHPDQVAVVVARKFRAERRREMAEREAHA